MKLYKKTLASLLALCLLLSGCVKPQEEEQEQRDKTISEIAIPGMIEFCVDEAGEYYYYAVTGESTIFKCAMDGTPVAQYTVDADNGEPDVLSFMEDQLSMAVNLSGLSIYGDTLYCFRNAKSTLLAVDISTGEDRLLATLDGIYNVCQMAAGTSSLMIMNIGESGRKYYVYQTDAGVLEPVPVDRLQNVAYAGGDTYWLNVRDEDDSYYFQEYQADTGALSEKYASNFTYELTVMTYDKETGLLYGTLYSAQYLCFNPREPRNVSRFVAQPVYLTPTSFQAAGNRLYILDKEKEIMYHFDPAAFVMENKTLKGYVTSEFSVTEWAGYNIDLEVISWEELALKVLAEDRDYDFVIMTTDMAEAVSLRDAMAYLPIPEETIADYWAECWPCVKQGATHNGDIWMLPLEVYARGLVYNEQNLAEYDLSMENIDTMPDLCEAVKLLHANGESGWYELQPMQEPLLQEYLWKQQKEDTMNFDTPEFRAIMEFIREEYSGNDYTDAYYRNSFINLNSWEGETEEEWKLPAVEREAARLKRNAARIYLNETRAGSTWELERYAGAEGIRVRSVPGMFGTEETVQISAQFLILNPNSENKEELMEFVADMAETYIADPSKFLSSNAERYGQDIVLHDICELYRNGEMVFCLPRELFRNYYLYVTGTELDPDEVVQELNRVVNMYYGE